jgi:hypothetical protein
MNLGSRRVAGTLQRSAWLAAGAFYLTLDCLTSDPTTA